MSPTIKTLLLALVALAMAGTAGAFYPWPQAVTQSETVGESLYEDFETDQVRRIKITKFAIEKGALDEIELRVKGDSWIMPGNKNFPVSNQVQRALTINCLVEKEVLEEVTDELAQHRDYGVVDPELFATMPDRSALGTKITFEGLGNKEIANLVVGKPVKDAKPNERGEIQHYVVVPGQPVVYIINLDPRSFPTDFRAWIDPNLFGLPRKDVEAKLRLTKTQIGPEEFGKKAPEKIYRAEIRANMQAQRMELSAFEIATKEAQFADAKLNADMTTTWQMIGARIPQIYFGEVKKKAKTLAAVFRQPSADRPDEDYAALKDIGFYKTGFKNGMPQFETSNGRFEIVCSDGVVMSLLFGAIATEASADSNELNRYTLMTAEFDESLLPAAPEKPADANEDQEREFLRKMEARNQVIDKAKEFVSQFNDSNADWVYMVANPICDQLLPEIDISQATLVQKEKPAANSEEEPEETQKKADTPKESETPEESEKKPEQADKTPSEA